MGPTHPPLHWVPWLFTGGKVAGAWRWPPHLIYFSVPSVTCYGGHLYFSCTFTSRVYRGNHNIIGHLSPKVLCSKRCSIIWKNKSWVVAYSRKLQGKFRVIHTQPVKLWLGWRSDLEKEVFVPKMSIWPYIQISLRSIYGENYSKFTCEIKRKLIYSLPLFTINQLCQQ